MKAQEIKEINKIESIHNNEFSNLYDAVARIDETMFHGYDVFETDIHTARELYKQLPVNEYPEHCQDVINDCEKILIIADKRSR